MNSPAPVPLNAKASPWPIEKYRDAIYLDLETLGNSPLSPVLEIGAVRMLHGEVLSKFQVFIDIDEQIRMGMVPNWSTMAWWMDDAAVTPLARRVQLDAKRIPVAQALADFSGWVADQKSDNSPEGIPNWGNAPSFDQAILRTLYLQAGMEYPLNFRTECDYRDLLRKFDKQEINAAWKEGVANATYLIRELGGVYVPHSGLSDAAKEAFAADYLLLLM